MSDISKELFVMTNTELLKVIDHAFKEIWNRHENFAGATRKLLEQNASLQKRIVELERELEEARSDAAQLEQAANRD